MSLELLARMSSVTGFTLLAFRLRQSSVLRHIFLNLPITRMCDGCQRRLRQPIVPLPGRPQEDCPPYLHPRTRPCHHCVRSTTSAPSTNKNHKLRPSTESLTTVFPVAAREPIAVPKLSTDITAPALDAPVVLRSAASFKIIVSCKAFLKTPECHPDISAMVGSCLAGATATARKFSANSPL